MYSMNGPAEERRFLPMPSVPSPGLRKPDPALLEDLRARIRRIERPTAAGVPDPLSLGAAAIDGALPWGGLPRAVLHEIIGDDGAASGFCAALAARLAGGAGSVLWCRREHGLYGPGLAAFGLGLERLIVVRGRTGSDVLWAMEEGLRSGSLAAVVGEAEGIPPTAARRLQLAAEAGGATGLLLRPARGTGPPGPAVTRWRARAAPGASEPGGGAGAPRWRLELLRCRGGTPAGWLVEWRDETTGGFTVVAKLRHGSLDEAPGPASTVAAHRLAG